MMPSTSKKQHNFMAAVANNPAFAKKAGVPQSVGKEFSNADKGKTFKRGDDMASKMNPGMMAMMAKKKPMKMAGGGMPMKDGKPAFIGDGKGAMKKGGMAVKKMAAGGLTAGHKAADGVASKGKTKGMMVKMNKGGKTC
jgi:hypothetical protein